MGYPFLIPTGTPPPGTDILIARDYPQGDGTTVPAAVLVSTTGVPLDLATEATLAAVQAALAGTLTIRPARDTWSSTATQLTASGDTTVIAAPGAGQRLVLAGLRVQLEAATATTVLIKHGATTVGRLRLAADGDGLSEIYPPGREIVLPENTALIINLSGANATGVTVRHRTEAV